MSEQTAAPTQTVSSMPLALPGSVTEFFSTATTVIEPVTTEEGRGTIFDALYDFAVNGTGLFIAIVFILVGLLLLFLESDAGKTTVKVVGGAAKTAAKAV